MNRAITPLLSIVTVSRNAEETVGRALESVKEQAFPDLEHILIDGASIDNTVSIAKQLRWPKLRIQSEPDQGIADAMNKGVNLARGEWLLFLNADDYLRHSSIISQVSAFLVNSYDIVGFPVLYGGKASELQLKRPRGANWYLNFKTGLMHQGTFIKRELFESIGLYDIDFQITMDYEFFLRAYKRGAQFSIHDKPPIAIMGDEGISSQKGWPNLSKRLAEERLAQKKNSRGLIRLIQPLYWFIYPKYRYLLPS